MSGAFPWLWAGVPALADEAPLLRWALLAAALLWALTAARGAGRHAWLAGLLFVEMGLGFWIAAFGRPYGLFEHAAVTREAAFAAVTRARGAPSGILPDAPFEGGAWAQLAAWGLPETLTVSLPTLLPLVVLPASALLLQLLWRAPAAPLAAVLWLAFSTGPLDALRGAGFVPGLWARPAGALGLLMAVAAGLALPRVARLLWRAALAPVLLAGAALAVGGPAEPLSLHAALLLLTLDQWPFWLLALPAWRRADAATWVLAASGALLLLGSAAGFSVDPWGAQALLRLGLLLAAARTLHALLPHLGRQVRAALARVPRLRWVPVRGTAGDLALGVVLAACLPGSFLAWWQPLRADPAAHASLDPLPVGLVQAMRFTRVHTPPDAVFVTGEDWAAAVAVLGARRVLHAPRLQPVEDGRRRARVAYLAVTGRSAKGWRNARRYGVTHLLVGPGDLQHWGYTASRQLEERGRFRLRFETPDGFRVYELQRWGPAGHE